MKKIISIITLSVVLFSCKKELPEALPAITSQAQVNTVVNQRQTVLVDYSALNPCTNDSMQIHLIVTFITSVRFTADGFRATYEINYHGSTATGDVKYVVSGMSSDVITAKLVDGQYLGDKEYTRTKLQFIAPGGGNNMTFASLFHISFDASGNPIYDKAVIKGYCQ